VGDAPPSLATGQGGGEAVAEERLEYGRKDALPRPPDEPTLSACVAPWGRAAPAATEHSTFPLE